MLVCLSLTARKKNGLNQHGNCVETKRTLEAVLIFGHQLSKVHISTMEINVYIMHGTQRICQ